jgi:hypothetical protein
MGERQRGFFWYKTKLTYRVQQLIAAQFGYCLKVMILALVEEQKMQRRIY